MYILQVLNSQYTKPSRKKIRKAIVELRQLIDQKLKLALQSRVTVVCIYGQKGHDSIYERHSTFL